MIATPQKGHAVLGLVGYASHGKGAMSIHKPLSCADCVGYHWGNCRGFSRVTGSGRLPLLIVGEASGATEERKGEPFVGKAGQVLEKALTVSGLKREDYLITNLLRCRPPGNELKGESYERAALDHCRQYLDAVVAEHQPSLILALGDVPLRELSGSLGNISELRGYILQSIYGIPMIATFHPSHIARGAWHLFGVAMHDIRVAERYARLGVPKPLETRYELQPNIDVVKRFLHVLRADATIPVAYDIETAGILGEKEPDDWASKRIIQIQFSSAVSEALVLPWPHEGALEILKTPNMKWDWYGRLFDRKVLRSQGVTINGECHDLMDAWGHLQPNFSSSKDDTHGDKGVPSKLMGLQSCLSFYYPYEQPWKGVTQHALDSASASFDSFAEGEGWDESRRLEWIQGSKIVQDTLRFYGAKDADYTFRLGVKLFKALREAELW